MLFDRLAPILPLGHEFGALHMRSSAYECKPPILKKARTLKVKHFLLLTDSDCVIFGIEIYVYLTFGEVLEHHVFVSKADTTGLGVRISVAGVVLEFIRYLLATDPTVYFRGAKWRNLDGIDAFDETETFEAGPHSENHLLNSENHLLNSQNHLLNSLEFEIVNTLLELSQKFTDPDYYRGILFYSKDKPNTAGPSEFPVPIPKTFHTKISLFTRSAEAYLFPHSHKNPAKHVADGNVLFSWWLKALARVLDDSWLCTADIPGADPNSVTRFLADLPEWSTGNIHVDPTSDAKAVYCIPLFPDDPKGRFLEHLIVENRYKTVTTSQFWNELGYRQEFRLGNVVGIIGCTKKESVPLVSSQEEDAQVLPLKDYKKILEYVKGEDYSKESDILAMVNAGLPELFKQCGVNGEFVKVEGRQEVSGKKDKLSAKGPVQLTEKTAVNELTVKRAPRRAAVKEQGERKAVNELTVKRALVNDLNGLTKRAKPEQVNNLTSLVRKMKKD